MYNYCFAFWHNLVHAFYFYKKSMWYFLCKLSSSVFIIKRVFSCSRLFASERLCGPQHAVGRLPVLFRMWLLHDLRTQWPLRHAVSAPAQVRCQFRPVFRHFVQLCRTVVMATRTHFSRTHARCYDSDLFIFTLIWRNIRSLWTSYTCWHPHRHVIQKCTSRGPLIQWTRQFRVIDSSGSTLEKDIYFSRME